MLYINKKGKLIKKKELSFSKEKEIQTLIDENLSELLSLDFVVSEKKLGNFRFDTIAFDKETNSFQIIEYKKSANQSVIDQGYAYLKRLTERKADLVLEYNEKFGKSNKLRDFNWEQSRVIFISPNFNDFQLSTANSELPFRLFIIKKFDDVIISLEPVVSISESDDVFLRMLDQETVSKVNKEIKVYSEDYHLNKGNDSIREIYSNLKSEITKFKNVRVESKKIYIAFKARTNFCDMIILKDTITLSLNMKKGTLKDPFNMARIVNEIGHNGNGDYEVKINENTDFKYLLLLIEQSYQKNI